MHDKIIDEIRQRRRDLLKERYGGSVERWIDACRSSSRKGPKAIDLRSKRMRRAIA